jgi:hypothetical protein
LPPQTAPQTEAAELRERDGAAGRDAAAAVRYGTEQAGYHTQSSYETACSHVITGRDMVAAVRHSTEQCVAHQP